MPRVNIRIMMPAINLVLEQSRKQISIGFWRDRQRDCIAYPLLKIGNGEGEISPDILGFSEVSFQYFVYIGFNSFAAFPMANESVLKRGFVVSFDARWKFMSSEPMAVLQ